ncbi:MAG: hypothetical protein LIR50_03040 [Bacillota bacterium]|nr:hypothetical protein [Bacillota bacterium]
MFLVGFSFFQGNCFDDNVPIGDVHQMDLQNAIFDELKIDKGNELLTNKDKQSWSNNTIFQCKFQDLNFEAGNITLAGMPIEFIRIKKKKTDDLNWVTYKDLPFDINKKEYNWSDLFVQSLQDYDYAVLPVGVQNTEGDYGIQTISTDYDFVYILGAGDKQYCLWADLDVGEIETVSEGTFINTLNSKYPYRVSNGQLRYRKGHVKATLVTDDSYYDINRKSEKKYRENLYNFLIDEKPKIYKESEGTYILVSIPSDSVKFTPVKEVNRSIQSIDFDFYEIDDVNSLQALVDSGLIEGNLS